MALTYTEMTASVAARAFFYPSLIYNVARERLQENWNWFDLVTEVRWPPFPTILMMLAQRIARDGFSPPPSFLVVFSTTAGW